MTPGDWWNVARCALTRRTELLLFCASNLERLAGEKEAHRLGLLMADVEHRRRQ